MNRPPRVASLLPGATETVVALGLAGALVARGHECDHPPWVRALPVVTGSRLDTAAMGHGEVDAAVAAALAEGLPLHTLDAAALRACGAEVVVTQGLCAVCAVDAGGVATALGDGPAVRVVTLRGGTLDGVAGDIAALGAALGVPGAGARAAAAMRARVAAVARSTAGRPPVRVAVLEWLDPPWAAGHWVPGMVAAAGGRDVLAAEGAPSRRVGWDEVRAARPEVVVVAPCGEDLGTAMRLAGVAREALGARSGARFVAMDGGAHLSRPGPRLAEGVEALAEALFPCGTVRGPAGGWAPV